jgi:hypothetical protein
LKSDIYFSQENFETINIPEEPTENCVKMNSGVCYCGLNCSGNRKGSMKGLS